jgi:hypothetical protein
LGFQKTGKVQRGKEHNILEMPSEDTKRYGCNKYDLKILDLNITIYLSN